MMPFGLHAQEMLLRQILNGDPWTPPSNLYLSLHVGDTSFDGSNEIIPSERKLITFATPVDFVAASTNAQVWASTPGGDISHVGIWDAETDGNFIYGGVMNVVKFLVSGEGITFEIGTVKVRHGEVIA